MLHVNASIDELVCKWRMQYCMYYLYFAVNFLCVILSASPSQAKQVGKMGTCGHMLLLVCTNCVTCTCVIRRCASKFNIYASMNRVQRCYCVVWGRFIREITYIRVRVLLLKASLTKDINMQRIGRGILFLLVDYWLLSIPFLCSHKIVTSDYFFLCKLILSLITPTSCVNVRKAYRITGEHTNTSTCIQKDPRSRSVC